MSDDLISRQDVIDVLNDGAELLRRFLDETYVVGDERAKYEWGLGLIESYIYDMDELPSAESEIVRCKDAVSKASVLETYADLYDVFEDNKAIQRELDEVYDRINALPSAQPERKKGKWERHYTRPNVYADLCWHCSVCGYKNADNYVNVYYNYCPNCGARMEVEHENNHVHL